MLKRYPKKNLPVRQRAFTLIELLIVLVIAAILLSVAAPSLSSFLTNNSVQSHARDLSSAMAYARSEAIALGEEIAVCGSSDGSTCNASDDWSSGWIVFMDNGAGAGTAFDGIRTGDEILLTVYEYEGRNTLQVSDSSGSAINSVNFKIRGAVRQNDELTLKICEPDNDVYYARAVLIRRTGLATRSFDIKDSGGSAASDGIYEDVTGTNLTCT